MSGLRRILWILWIGALLLLGAMVAMPRVVAPDPAPYSDAGASVLGFVLTLLAMTAGVGSLAVREALLRDVWSGAVDPHSPEGKARVVREMLAAWVLCLVVAAMGVLLAWLSARPSLAWPYVLAAVAMLAFHAPRTSILGGPAQARS